MKHGEDNSSPVCSVCFVSFFVMTSIAVSSVVPVAGFEQEVHPSANAIATSYPWFDEIEKTIIQSVVSTFGLDFLLFQDKLGGNVDTIHNVRKGIYASEAEETRYRIRQDYDSDEYHNHDDYIKAGKRNNQLQQEGCLHDAYRNSTMSCGEKYDRDHVISAKEIHDDPGRILAEQSGAELANQESNLQATLSTINKSKKESSLDEYVKKLPRLIDEHKKTVARHERRLQALLSDPYNNRGQIQKLEDKIRKTKEKVRALESVDKDAMLERDRKARSAYEEKINRAYYGGSKFLKKTAIASATAAIAMGARQVLGLVCAEIWFELRDGIPSIFRKSKNELGLNDLFMHFKTMLQRIWERIKLRFHDFLTTFKEGAIGGALSSVTTTIFNIFTTTAKGAIKIIREAWLYLTKALKLVLFNPENLDLIDLGKAVTGVLAAGASALAGSFVYAELVPVLSFPMGGELATFAGVLVTGLLTLALNYLLLYSDFAKKAWAYLEKMMPHAELLHKCKEANAELDRYLDEWARIEFNIDVDDLAEFACELDGCADEEKRSVVLANQTKKMNIDLPFEPGNSGSVRDFLRKKAGRTD